MHLPSWRRSLYFTTLLLPESALIKTNSTFQQCPIGIGSYRGSTVSRIGLKTIRSIFVHRNIRRQPLLVLSSSPPPS